MSEAVNLLHVFETKLKLWVSQLHKGICDHFEHLNKTKISFQTSHNIFDASKYSLKALSIYEAFEKTIFRL